jgi:hypothetical protein
VHYRSVLTLYSLSSRSIPYLGSLLSFGITRYRLRGRDPKHKFCAINEEPQEKSPIKQCQRQINGSCCSVTHCGCVSVNFVFDPLSLSPSNSIGSECHLFCSAAAPCLPCALRAPSGRAESLTPLIMGFTINSYGARGNPWDFDTALAIYQ